MRPSLPHTPIDSAKRYFFIIAAAAFVLSSIVGLGAALKTAAPDYTPPWIAFSIARPLHVFLAIAAVLTGLQGLVLSLARPFRIEWPARLQIGAMAAFICIGTIAIMLGAGSGREYFSWPAFLSALLVMSMGVMVWRQFAGATALERRSPEGFWLIGLGGLLVTVSLIESELWRLDAVASDYVRNLTIQWHAIDGFFAGVNIALYGCAVYLMTDKPKPLRRPTLFLVAGFGLLFTFGHHHYVSPQPTFLKSLAFIASMIAVISFWRHLATYKVMHGDDYGARHFLLLWRSVEFWTLVSIATGVFFAIPQFNLLVHGTYLIVAHAMGSMIGVNLLIIAAGALQKAHRPAVLIVPRILLGVRLVNLALVLIWIDLGAAGVVKGVMRVSGGYRDYQPIVDFLIYGFPLAGAILVAGISLLAGEIIRTNVIAPGYRRVASDAAETI
ncbi:MAG: cbb3-type cytochrome c oxidase subunit I [Parvularculaceae bacterium]